MAGHLDFYFFYGSIHSYLSVMRIGALASAAGVEVRWQPFNLREILIEQNNTAFTKNDVKMSYFWHDVERRARCHNIPFAGRAPYPADPQRKKNGATTTRAPHFTTGSSVGARQASAITSSIFLPRSVNQRRRSSPARRAQRASVCRSRRPMPRASSAFSARRRSQSAPKSSGATIDWRTRSPSRRDAELPRGARTVGMPRRRARGRILDPARMQ
jgi:DSBA-like thioredoxin domain